MKEKIIVKKRMKETFENEINDFGSFFHKNAVQHYDYFLQSVGYVTSTPSDFVNVNLWLSDCFFKKRGNFYKIEHKKMGASLKIFPNKLSIFEQYDEGDFLTISCELLNDKNYGTFVFVFKKK